MGAPPASRARVARRKPAPPRVVLVIFVRQRLEGSSTIVELPSNEAQTRPLTSLEPDQQVEAWQAAVASATTGKVTARHVEAAVGRWIYPLPGDIEKAKAIARIL